MADRVLQAIFDKVLDKAQIESPPKIEGKQMITVIAPDSKK